MAFSPDGRFLAAAGESQLIRLWDVTTWKEVRTLKGHPSDVRNLAFSPDGKTLASCGGSSREALGCGDRPGERDLRGHPSFVLSVAFDAEGRRLVSGDLYGRVKVWDVERPQPLRLNENGLSPRIAFHPDGQVPRNFLFGLRERASTVGPRTAGLPGSFGGTRTAIEAVSLSHDGSLMASGSNDGTVRIWDMETGRQLNVLDHGQGVIVRDVAFHFRDSTMLATACNDGTLRLWTIDSTERSPSAPTVVGRLDAEILDLAFRPPLGRELAGGRDGSVHVWNVETGAEVARSPSRQLGVEVAFRPRADSWPQEGILKPLGVIL